jgi:hypothetical protein
MVIARAFLKPACLGFANLFSIAFRMHTFFGIAEQVKNFSANGS